MILTSDDSLPNYDVIKLENIFQKNDHVFSCLPLQDMDVEMDDVLDVNVKPDADLMDGLPDLRTVISRPSSVSDADTDDYNIKPNKMMKK